MCVGGWEECRPHFLNDVFFPFFGTLPHPHGQALNVVSPPAHPPTCSLTRTDIPEEARRGRGL